MDIVDVVSDFVTLKKAGKDYRALSPFNAEKTPSFYVVPSKNIFKDFSSGKGGDAFTFVMEHEGLTYPEAIRFLAKKYGVEIKEDGSPERMEETAGQKESLYLVMGYARDHFRHNLLETEEGRGIGLSYFRERGLTDPILEKFELGYALDSWDALSAAAVKDGYSQEVMEKAGLLSRKEERVYDRFRGRVIFPVHNLSGKVIAFGARMLSKEKQPNQPKYINSPETDIYHKSQVLFGMNLARNVIRQKENCYLVEGYMDVIAMHQAGIENVVASSGTALTEEQVKLIKRFSDNVTLLFDGDEAGIRAAIRGIDLLLSGGLNVKLVLLPDGHDPDSYSRSTGSAALQDYLRDNARDFISFIASLYAKDSAGDPIRKAESIREIVKSIAKVPDGIKRSVYTSETARLLEVPEHVLLTELNKIIIADRRTRDREAPVTDPIITPDPLVQQEVQKSIDPDTMIHEQERESIRLLLNYPSAMVEDRPLTDFMFFELEDVSFLHPLYLSVFQTMRGLWLDGKPIDADHFLHSGNQEQRELVMGLITRKYTVSRHWSEKYFIHIPDEPELIPSLAISNVNRMKYRLVRRMIATNLGSIREAEQARDEENLMRWMDTGIRLKEAERELAGALGIVIG